MGRFVGDAKLGWDGSFGALEIFGIVDQLADQRFAVFSHALDERAGKEAWRLAEREGNFHSATGSHFAAQTFVFFLGEARVEGVAIGGDHTTGIID